MLTKDLDIQDRQLLEQKIKAKGQFQLFGYTLAEIATLTLLFGAVASCYIIIYEIIQSAF